MNKSGGKPVSQKASVPYKPTVLDLFCGAGGLALGFHQAGYKILGGIDHWAPAIQTFSENFSSGTGVLADLRSLDFHMIDSVAGTQVDVIVGGPSCQGFSTSGGFSKAAGRDENDPRNRLFINYLQLVEYLRPSWIVFENVTGLLLYNQGRVALDIVKAFAEIGYSVSPMILLAADFGVPQLRRRLFFIGNRTGAPSVFPAATHGNPELWRNYSLPFAHLSRIGHGNGGDTLPHVTFGEACDDLPPVDEGQELDGVPYGTKAKTPFQRHIRNGSRVVRQHSSAELAELDRTAARILLPGQNWRDIPAAMLPQRFQRIRPYDATTVYKRLKLEEPAYTITTKFNEASTGAFIHPTQNRTLTLREAARLQSFPDTFIFSGSQSQVRHQIGNAVPPMLARCIAEAILPSVIRDAKGLVIPQLRSSVLVEHDLRTGDPLRLKAPRKSRNSNIQLELT